MLAEWKKIADEFRPALPGLQLVLAVALLSRFLHGLIPDATVQKAVGEVLMAVALGMYVRNALGVAARFEPGVKFALNRLLRLGIILLGLRLSLQDVAATGASALLLVVVCILLALGLAYAAGRLFNLPSRLAALIGLGTAICGNSAIVAAAPVIEAPDEDVGFAVATITLFGTLAVVVYPLVGQLAGFGDRAFGLWAGTAVNDTSQVVAAAAAFSPAALDVATIVKLTRNTLLAPILILVGLAYGRTASQSDFSLSRLVPGFVLGFLLLALARTAGVALGVLPQNVVDPGDLHVAASALKFVDEGARLAILMALAGVGLNTGLAQMRRLGLRPFIVGLCVALAVVSLVLIVVFGLGN
jgi:uncharacterized integral membrane protein (TIGR00698 family)